MMDFNGSESSTSISEKFCVEESSLGNLVREEVLKVIQEKYPDLCHTNKADVPQKKEPSTEEEDMPSLDLEVLVERINEMHQDKDHLIVENFSILDRRITALEQRISKMIKAIPNLRCVKSNKFQKNTTKICNNLSQLMNDFKSVEHHVTHQIKEEKQQEINSLLNSQLKTVESKEHMKIIDFSRPKLSKRATRNELRRQNRMYYEMRQNQLNLLFFKKSEETMRLNQRPFFNPYIVPKFRNIKCPVDPLFPNKKAAFVSVEKSDTNLRVAVDAMELRQAGCLK